MSALLRSPAAYSTKYITREEAENMLREIRARQNPISLEHLSDIEIEDELDSYSDEDEYSDILGVLHNFSIRSRYEDD